jgi:acetylglutamate kinase
MSSLASVLTSRVDVSPPLQGLRVTDAPTLEVAEMVLCGLINKSIASLIKRAGARAVGISGKDDGLLVGEKVTRKTKDESGAFQVMREVIV